MAAFTINFLDHVAIRVKDIKASADWYQKVLGLRYYQLPEWGEYPVFLMAGKSGIALFPARTEDPPFNTASKNVKIDHFAFNVSVASFKKARAHYESMGLEYSFQDHHYFHSIYTRDPDGHTVELTTLMVPEDTFYSLGKPL